MLHYERTAWAAGHDRVAGIDEAGRGPLAGPVVAAAVILPHDGHDVAVELDGLNDSKKLSAARRERFFLILEERHDVQVGVGVVDVEEIDRINILRATHLAMQQALADLPRLPDHALVDGRPVTGLPCSSTAIVGGDGLSLSIAAASVVAKVMRDRLMEELDARYPAYGFARHKGYGTRVHLDALNAHGPAPCHRRSFRPVSELGPWSSE
jgi:ribonuclease HII